MVPAAAHGAGQTAAAVQPQNPRPGRRRRRAAGRGAAGGARGGAGNGRAASAGQGVAKRWGSGRHWARAEPERLGSAHGTLLEDLGESGLGAGRGGRDGRTLGA